MTLTNEMIEALKVAAKRQTLNTLEVSPSEACGDDCAMAFYMGCDNGETILARAILETLGIEY